MARNKFDVDEVLETPFDIRHLKRSLVYAAKYKKHRDIPDTQRPRLCDRAVIAADSSECD